MKLLRWTLLAFVLALLTALDWNSISPTAHYPNILSDLEERDEHTAMLDYVGDTNLPTGTIRKNPSTKKLEEWDGSTWTLLSWHTTIDGHIADASLHGQLPVGTSLEFAGASLPSGFLWADGECISRSTYSALFAVIGTTYGACDGSTTFAKPDRRQRFGLGKGVSGTGSVLGATGGAIDHTHTGPSHTHTGPSHTHGLTTAFAKLGYEVCCGAAAYISWFEVSASSHSRNSRAGFPPGPAYTNSSTTTGHTTGAGLGGSTDADGTGTTGASGTGATGPANPPFIALNYIIKY